MRILRLIFSLLHLLASAALAGVAVAAAAGRFNRRLDLLSHFAPIYLGLAVIALLSAVLVQPGMRRASAALVGLALVACSVMMVPEIYSALTLKTTPNAPAHLKLIQFNVLGGGGDPEGAIAWILSQNADVIVLEEAGNRITEPISGRGHYYINTGGGGAVILSRSKPVANNSVDWSTMWRIPSAKRPPRPPYSYTRFDDQHGSYAVFGVHQPWPMKYVAVERGSAALRRAMVQSGVDDAIVAGDFNSTPWSNALRREDRTLGVERRTRALASWPAARVSHNVWNAPFPVLPIDHVYAGANWATVKVERGPELGSDHYPIIIDLAHVRSGSN